MVKTEIQTIEEENRRLFATRLREVVGKMGGPKAASDALDVPLSTLNTYLAGQADPKVSVAMRIASAARTSLAYLSGLTTILDASKLDFGRVEQLSETYDDGDVVMIPRRSVRVSAGLGLANDDFKDDEKIPMSRALLRRLGVSPANAHIVQASGDSMEETIADADDVLIDIGDTALKSEGIYTVAVGDLAMIKRVQPFAMMDSVTLISDNQRYPPTTIRRADQAQFRVIGRAKLVMRVL